MSIAIFSKIIGSLYDAAIDASLFPAVMNDINHYLDSAVSAVFSENVLSNTGKFAATSYVDEAWSEQYYAEGFISINPVRARALPIVKTGDTFNTLTFLTDEEFRKSRYYCGWLEPKGYLDTLSTILERSSMNFALISTLRHADQGYADSADFERMNLIAPHVRRAINIAQLIDFKSYELGQFTELVDRLIAPVLFCDKSGRILHENTAATQLLDAGDIVKRRNNKLIVQDAIASVKMTDALKASNASDLDLDSSGAAILLCDKPRRYVAHVLPLKSGHRADAGSVYGASIAIFIRDVGVDIPSAASSLLQLFNLTPRELTVILAITAGHNVRDTAAILGLSEETIKTHLKSIFGKVGVRKQSELVSVVAQVANPFIPDHNP